jgi:multidrug efflux pump subunit AcrB
MQNNNKIIEWTINNRSVMFLLIAALFAAGIYSLVVMPKQEQPEFTIRQGVVVGVYPGASSADVEEQLARPLERYLFTFTEVNRKKTTSRSEDGICYVFVELADDVKDKNTVWSKIKHGLNAFKPSLPQGVAAVVANDNFGDVASVLITMESDDKTGRDIDRYCDALEDRLRAVPTVANVRRYGSQQERITIYVDNEKLSAYGVGTNTMMMNLFAQGYTTSSGSLENDRMIAPVHVSESYRTEQEIANQIIFASPQGDVVRVKDVGSVVREYPDADNYITHNGRRCVLLSVEVLSSANIVSFGDEVNAVIEEFKSELPESVHINRIVDQPKIVGASVSHFLRELLIAICAVILVTMILLPFRVAVVSALSIPISIAITLAIMHLAGIPLNLITLAALIVVLGMVVDDSIVVVDNYIDKLDNGIDRREAAVTSAREYFKSVLSATLAISITFFPVIFTVTGMIYDFLEFFPWTVTIALGMSLVIAICVIPLLQYLLIKKGIRAKTDEGGGQTRRRKSILDYVQAGHEWLITRSFAHPKTTVAIALASVAVGVWLFTNIPKRMMPIAERDQFAVEIYLPQGSPLEKTAAVCDSLEHILRRDTRVKSVSAFIGTSSPRFHMTYAPNMPSKAYGQFIVNTVSNKATEEMLNEYADSYAFRFPEAYVRFKQLDYQMAEAPIEIRFTGDDLAALKTQAEKLSDYLYTLDECLWVRTSFGQTLQSVEIDLDATESGRLGINKTLVSLGVATDLTGTKVTEIWEGNYAVPVYIESENDENTVSSLGDVQVSGLMGATVPLRQVASLAPQWNESAITHRNGLRAFNVLADVRRNEYPDRVFSKVKQYVETEIVPQLPDGVKIQYGGQDESDEEMMSSLLVALILAFGIIFMILLFHFRKVKLAVIVLASVSLSLFGAAIGFHLLNVDFGAFAIMGVIALAGIIVRNGIIMYDYIEYLRNNKGLSVRQAAIDAGKRRMRPIFLTSAAASMGVLPMIINRSPMWSGMATTIFFGTLVSIVLVVTVLPVVYWLAYRKEDDEQLKIKN